MIKSILPTLVLTAIMQIHGMQEPEGWQSILACAQQVSTHNETIEAFFGKELEGQKPTRDLRFIHLQSLVHNSTHAQTLAAARMTLLQHLELAYHRKELIYLQSALVQCNGKIDDLIKALEKK